MMNGEDGHLESTSGYTDMPNRKVNDMKDIYTDHILKKMESWKIPKTLRTIACSMLKAGILNDIGYTDNVSGAPQGGYYHRCLPMPH